MTSRRRRSVNNGCRRLRAAGWAGLVAAAVVLAAGAGDALTVEKTDAGVAVCRVADARYTGNRVPNARFKQALAHWQTRFPEQNETKYAGNHKLVSVAAAPADRNGRAVKLHSPPGVAGSQGVKAVTPLIAIASDGSYEFGADVFRTAPACKIFLEGYRRDAKQTEAGNNRFPGFVRVYRSTIHVKTPKGKWGTARRVIKLGKVPARYRPDYVLIKLYAYYPPGEAYFADVFLRPTTTETGKTYGAIRASDAAEADAEVTDESD